MGENVTAFILKRGWTHIKTDVYSAYLIVIAYAWNLHCCEHLYLSVQITQPKLDTVAQKCLCQWEFVHVLQTMPTEILPRLSSSCLLFCCVFLRCKWSWKMKGCKGTDKKMSCSKTASRVFVCDCFSQTALLMNCLHSLSVHPWSPWSHSQTVHTHHWTIFTASRDLHGRLHLEGTMPRHLISCKSINQALNSARSSRLPKIRASRFDYYEQEMSYVATLFMILHWSSTLCL